MHMKEYIAFDIDDTVIRYGIIGEHADIFFQDRTPTPAEGGPGIVDTVLSLIEEMKARCRPEGVCISTAGFVDALHGYVYYAPESMPGYTGTDWKKLVESGCGLPCEAENNVNCIGLAEYTSGAAINASSCLCLSAGDVVGGCFLIDGKVWHGYAMSACQIGYLPMYGSTFSTLASSGALVRKVAAIKGTLGLNWNEEKIFDEAMKGDRDCIEAIDAMCDVLGRGISTICYVINPEIVVLCGGLVASHHSLLPKIRVSMEKYLIDPITSSSFIATGAHTRQAGLLGAFYHYKNSRD